MSFFAKILLAFNLSLAASETSSSSKTFWIVVNGGNSLSNNFQMFRDDVAALIKAPSGSTKIELNGPGPGQVQSIEFQDNMIRRLINGPIKYLTDSQVGGLPATIQNLKDSTLKAAKNSPSQVVYIYRNHGGEEGFSMWYDLLTLSQKRKIENSFPPNTLVQTIELHCKAGDAISSTRQSEISTPEMLLESYPKNHCGFANSNRGQLVSTKDSSFVSRLLADRLKAYKKTSLDDLEYLTKDRMDTPPMLTSDYFIEGLAQIVCENRTKYLPYACNRQTKAVTHQVEENQLLLMCSDFSLDQKENARENYYLKQDHCENLYYLQKFPGKIDSFLDQLALQEATMTTKLIANLNFKMATNGPELAELRSLALNNLIGTDDYIKFKDKCYLDLGGMSHDLEKIEIEDENTKTAVENWKKTKKTFFAKMLNRPELKELKERYENIRNCEHTPLP